MYFLKHHITYFTIWIYFKSTKILLFKNNVIVFFGLRYISRSVPTPKTLCVYLFVHTRAPTNVFLLFSDSYYSTRVMLIVLCVCVTPQRLCIVWRFDIPSENSISNANTLWPYDTLLFITKSKTGERKGFRSSRKNDDNNNNKAYTSM